MFFLGRKKKLEGERSGDAQQLRRLSAELEAAGEIVAAMLLPRAELARLSDVVEVDAILQPARLMGGDLYDAFALPDGRLTVLVADVTGKGVPAAMFSALAKGLCHTHVPRPGVTLGQAVSEVNAQLGQQNRQAMALSLLAATLDPTTGLVELCSAGHEDPIVIRADGAVEILPVTGGVPLCIVDDWEYYSERASLRPGDTLLFYTDGLTEAQSPAGDLFGLNRVLDTVRPVGPGAPLAAYLEALVAQVREFEGGDEPSDDLTLLAVRLRGGG